MNKSGHFFDKAGNAIDNGWDATKKRVKKVGNEVKDVFNGNDKDEKNDKNKEQ